MTASPQPFQLPGYSVLHEQELRFGSEDPKAVDAHPLQGLLRFGPYSQDKLAAIADPIRVAIIAPAGQVERVNGLLRELQQSHQPRERRQYLPGFPGFSKVFHVNMGPAGPQTNVELPGDLTDQIKAAEKPHLKLAEALQHALRALSHQRDAFDVVYILLDKAWEPGFYGGEGDDFNLHDYVKAIAAFEGIPTQFLNEDRSLAYYCRASVMWRLGIALYTKAGGVPWVLANIDPGTAYIGIDYALRPNTDSDSRFAICCSQVFDAEGSGLEFVAYEASGVRMFGKNPFLHRDQMMKVMSRSLAVYQRKHAGAVPSRIVVHKNTEFKPYEIDGVFDAFPNTENVELIHVQQNCGWRGVYITKPQQPNGYPCLRGSTFQLGPHTSLLWTQGDLPVVANGQSYFKEGKGIPEPLILNRHAGRGAMDDLCKETLALTKMDWNNDAPYDRMPVTLNFAGTLASVVKQMPKLEPRSYPVRLFM
tara:strand:+ start:9999 stop:11429 length:1431 start_codon:yes stop_codon:yes gene_type:complete